MAEILEFENEDEERAFWATHDSIDFLEGVEQVNLDYVGRDITDSNSKFLYREVRIPSHS